MKIITSISDMQRIADALRREGKRISVVPTMGFLHEGHLSLMRIAKEKSDVVIMTIFVNPTQFAPNEDFSKYPRDLERDMRLIESAGREILFTPSEKDMYPENYVTFVNVERITGVLEGKSRPTHFRGVTTVVAKLFNITKPHVAVFGQKDAQQAVVLKQMARDLNFDVDIIVAPIVREADGLAMSSRNVYLSTSERKSAPVLYRSLQHAKQLVEQSERNCRTIIEAMTKMITTEPSAQIDYISIADSTALNELSTLKKGDAVLISVAVHFDTTRLIDNIIITA